MKNGSQLHVCRVNTLSKSNCWHCSLLAIFLKNKNWFDFFSSEITSKSYSKFKMISHAQTFLFIQMQNFCFRIVQSAILYMYILRTLALNSNEKYSNLAYLFKDHYYTHPIFFPSTTKCRI